MLDIDLRSRRPSRNLDHLVLSGELGFSVLLPYAFDGEEDEGEVRLELWPPYAFGSSRVRIEFGDDLTDWIEPEDFTAFSLQVAIAQSIPSLTVVETDSQSALILSPEGSPDTVTLAVEGEILGEFSFVEQLGPHLFRVPFRVGQFARADGEAIEAAEFTLDVEIEGDSETAQVERLSLSRAPDTGFFMLSLGGDVTPRLFWDASPFEVRAALCAAGIDRYHVSREGRDFLFTSLSPGAASPLQVSPFISGPYGFAGTLDLFDAAKRLRVVRGPVEEAVLSVLVNGTHVYRERVSVHLPQGGSIADEGD